MFVIFFFQAEDGIRGFCLSRGLGDVYKRQVQCLQGSRTNTASACEVFKRSIASKGPRTSTLTPAIAPGHAGSESVEAWLEMQSRLITLILKPSAVRERSLELLSP